VIKNHRTQITFNTAARSIFIVSSQRYAFFAEGVHHHCKQRGILSHLIKPNDDSDDLQTLIKAYNPWAIINCDLIEEEAGIYHIQYLSQQFLVEEENNLKTVGFIPPWLEVEDAVNEFSCKTLMVRCDLMENPEFTLIENSFKSDPSTLSTILSSFPYISEFINASLDLMIDDCIGVWELSKFSITPVQDLVQENIFE
jgi:hypothetical protein